MLSAFIHVGACFRTSFLLEAAQYPTVCVTHFVYLSMDGHLGRFHGVAIVNNAARTLGVQMPLLDSAFNSFGYMPRSGIAEFFPPYF